MPRSPDSTTDTYLDVLRTLGVTDAALRRHHGADPGTPLRVAIDGDRGTPTADLLSALRATGRVLDLRDGLAVDDGDRLTAALGRFGYAIECSAAGDELAEFRDADGESVDAEDLVLRIRDVVTGDVERVHTAPDAAAAEASLRDELLGDPAIVLVELLDGRHLVAEARELDALAASYGDRIQPFDDPLLVPDGAIGTDDDASGHAATGAVASGSTAGSTTAPTGSTADSATGAPGVDHRRSADASGGDSFGDAVADADDATTDSIETALSRGGPSTHTIEGDDDLDAAPGTTVGGGPRRTVSTTGIDEVFDQLEAATASNGGATETGTVSSSDDAGPTTDDRHEPAGATTATTDATTRTMSDSDDPPTDASASSDDPDRTATGLTGGPTRTVSTTSADDILARATGERDFEEIAAEEGDADPDAVLAEGEVPPALADSGVSPAPSDGSETDATDLDESTAGAAESSIDSAEPRTDSIESPADAPEPSDESDDAVGTADRPPADPAAAASPGEGDVPSATGADSAAIADVDDATVDELLAAAGGVGPDDHTASDADRASTSAIRTADDEPADDDDDAGLVGRITSTIFGR